MGLLFISELNGKPFNTYLRIERLGRYYTKWTECRSIRTPELNAWEDLTRIERNAVQYVPPNWTPGNILRKKWWFRAKNALKNKFLCFLCYHFLLNLRWNCSLPLSYYSFSCLFFTISIWAFPVGELPMVGYGVPFNYIHIEWPFWQFRINSTKRVQFILELSKRPFNII